MNKSFNEKEVIEFCLAYILDMWSMDKTELIEFIKGPKIGNIEPGFFDELYDCFDSPGFEYRFPAILDSKNNGAFFSIHLHKDEYYIDILSKMELK